MFLFKLHVLTTTLSLRHMCALVFSLSTKSLESSCFLTLSVMLDLLEHEGRRVKKLGLELRKCVDLQTVVSALFSALVCLGCSLTGRSVTHTSETC